jgi:TRAP-type C4-dicarboxylate transport system permease large subunit
MTVPVLGPIIVALGFDPLWFGVIFTVLIMIGLATPPVGLNLYVLKGIAGDATIAEISRGSVPYVLVQIGCLIAFTIWPQLVLWLPSAMMGK